MAKRKALGQDPLSWISATQKVKPAPRDSDPEEAPAAPAPSVRDSGMSGSFLAIYVINMLLLLLLAGLAYVDMGRRIDILTAETQLLREKVNLLEEHELTLTPLPQDWEMGR